ncbi:hypothetical protein QP027_09855 [Corynebacterium breve]|uniref:DUF559 domain-containing protein n=1 Tax=Corynebacterium breve TaxID=3049799 RepID=A0ABY8VE62_9CORY|nr:hypothetical protein [Corynebacterium breve]WIM67397.1 hypothetical protein QP027_09855 [Corynebacterium breve]
MTPEFLLQSLAPLHHLSNTDTRTLRQLHSGKLKRLSPNYAIDSDVFEQAPRHLQHWIDIVAKGRDRHEAVAIGRTAARLHGMWVVPLTDEVAEFALPSGHVPPLKNQAAGTRYRYAALTSDDITIINGARAVHRVRAFLDIARYHGFAEGLVAADWLLATGFTKQTLTTQLNLLGRVKGVAVARRCIAHAVAKSESPYESFARALLIEAGIGDLEVQKHVGSRTRVDLCVAGFLIIEVDGESKYDGATFGKSTDSVIVAERKREKWLQNLGYRVLRVSPADLHRHSASFAATVRSIVARAA